MSILKTVVRLNRKLPILIPEVARHPRLLPKILMNYARLAAGGKALRTVDFSVTFDCQCKCEHCYASPMINTTQEPMTFDQMRSAIDQSLELGAIIINFVGGEPLCYPRLDELIAAIPPHRAIATLSTNGLELTPERVRRLAAAGLGYIAISMDYDDAERHDRFRGRKGVYAAAMAGIKLAKAAGIGVVINTTVTRDNMEDGTVGRLVEFTRRSGVTHTMHLAATVGNWERHGQVSLTPEHRAQFEAYRQLPHVRWDGSSNYLVECCAAGGEKISISAFGDVLPCAMIQMSYGNLKQVPLKDAWARMLAEPCLQKKAPHCIAVDDPQFMDTVIRKINRHPMRPMTREAVLGAGPGDGQTPAE
jgi:MoaA/NifB/PqqE/SkfB family radical SAM enzyme